MRALTLNEMDFVAGGFAAEDEGTVVTVKVKRNPNTIYAYEIAYQPEINYDPDATIGSIIGGIFDGLNNDRERTRDEIDDAEKIDEIYNPDARNLERIDAPDFRRILRDRETGNFYCDRDKDGRPDGVVTGRTPDGKYAIDEDGDGAADVGY